MNSDGNVLTVKNSSKESVRLLRKAAENGHAMAAYDLAMCYEVGQGVTKSLQQASHWYRKSADAGNAMAKCKLGTQAHDGENTPNLNPQTAIDWYIAAADLDNADTKK